MMYSRLIPAAALVAAVLTPTTAASAAPTQSPCPEQLTGIATCYTGQDAHGAFYAMAVPNTWHHDLVVHAHGGPDLGDASDPERSVEDLGRWSVMVKEGWAWAGSSYRRGGYGARMAAADTEEVRRLFVEKFGEPGTTLLHGQSWGGDVAAKLAETDGAAYDGVLLTSGVLAGGSRGYDYRVDLRAVTEYYCGDLPLSSSGIRTRLRTCTGYDAAPAERTALQQRTLDDILAVTRIPERTLESHLRFSVLTFDDIVSKRLGGRNPFDNRTIRYSGSHDDRALNAGVERFRPDRTAVRDLSYDSDLTGQTSLPTLTMHAIDDPTAFVEHESAYRETREAAGTAGSLVQVFTDEHEHSALSDSEYAAALRALATWTSTGTKPSPASVAAGCATTDATYAQGCFVRPDFHPASYADRVEPRPGARHWPAMTAQQERRWSTIPGIGIAP